MELFDTPGWRSVRDQKLREWVGDQSAVDFIVRFGDVCEVWDDLIDRDKKVLPSDINRAFWTTLVDIPLNPFFDRYKQSIVPILITGMNAWIDSTTMEHGERNDRVFAYVLRDWYVEFVAFIICLLRGREYLWENSMEIRRFFTHHETLEQYMEKLNEHR